MARRWLHLVASEHYLEYRSFISLHTFGLCTSWTSLQEWFDFWPCWPNCATWWWKRGTVGVFRPLAWILITQPLHMWCMHWLGESSELILFLVFVKFQPSAGRKMAIHIYFSLRCCPCPILWGWHHSWWFTIFWQILDWFLQKFTGFVDIRLWKHPIDYGCDRLQGAPMAVILLLCPLVAFGG